MFQYNVDIHFNQLKMWDTYSVTASTIDNARYKAVERVKSECGENTAMDIDCIRVYSTMTGEMLKEYQSLSN